MAIIAEGADIRLRSRGRSPTLYCRHMKAIGYLGVAGLPGTNAGRPRRDIGFHELMTDFSSEKCSQIGHV